jgi:hypothetical protein
MPGQIKRIIDSILEQRAKGNTTLLATTRTKLIIKGVNPDHYHLNSPDDPEMLEKLRSIAAELGARVARPKEP